MITRNRIAPIRITIIPTRNQTNLVLPEIAMRGYYPSNFKPYVKTRSTPIDTLWDLVRHIKRYLAPSTTSPEGVVNAHFRDTLVGVLTSCQTQLEHLKSSVLYGVSEPPTLTRNSARANRSSFESLSSAVVVFMVSSLACTIVSCLGSNSSTASTLPALIPS